MSVMAYKNVPVFLVHPVFPFKVQGYV